MNDAALEHAVAIYGHERLRSHEGGHAAAALLLGLSVQSVHADFHTLSELEAMTERELEDAAGKAVIASHDSETRHVALATLCGPMAEGKTAYWPPRWPLTLAPVSPDERDVIDAARYLDLDEDGYRRLCADAKAITELPVFQRLHTSIMDALEPPPHTIGAAELNHLHEQALMEHITLKAIATTTDQGTFEAVISTEAVDREKDVVSADAMVEALRKWNRPIPLAWNHSTSAADIFGTINPQSVQALNGEVVADGQVDLDSGVGREAWRSFKSRAIGFSFGYLILTATKRADGGRHITALDVFEVSATPTPMNNGTRVLGTKAVDDTDRIHNQWRDTMTNLLTNTETPDTLREKSMRIARAHTPITIATFDC